MRLTLFSEKFSPAGGAAGQGIKSALGRPRLDNFSVLVREAVQNSWDARLSSRSKKDVSFTARLETFTDEQLEKLNRVVFAEKPSRHPSSKHPLDKELKPNMSRLILEDRGTVGLGGPVFMQSRASEEEARNFIQFFRLHGRNGDGIVSGGTYGFGKAVFFNASKASTIVVHTKCLNGGETQERLMAMSLWRASDQSMETGRYWWGIPSARHGGATAPVVGQQANILAKDIGFIPFGKDETGTSIMILAPHFYKKYDTDTFNAARCIAESMVMWFWPRMLGSADREGSLKFSVYHKGEPINLLDPRRDAPFSSYSIALGNLVAKVIRRREIPPPHIVNEIRSVRPGARLGWLSLALTPRGHRNVMAVCDVEDHIFNEQIDQRNGNTPSCHHIALIRGPGQVIKYLRCRNYPDPAMEYSGVFMVDGDPDEVNVAYAKAEPPSHDDWVADELEEDWHKRYVRIGLREIRNNADVFADSGRIPVNPTSQDPLGAISAELGELISAPGSGPSPGGGPGRGERGGASRGRRAIQLQITGDGTLEEIAGLPVYVLPFRIGGDIGMRKFRVCANPKVLVAGGGTETEAPEGEDKPRIIGWSRPGKKTIEKAELELLADYEGDWNLLVGIPGEAMIVVSLSLIEEQG